MAMSMLRAVLVEGKLDRVAHVFRHGRVRWVDVAHLEPVVARRLLVDRRHEIVAVHLEVLALGQVGSIAPGTLRREDRLDVSERGIADLVMLFAVAVAFERDKLLVERRNLDVVHPARNDHARFGAGDGQRLFLAGGVAERRLVHPGDVAGVQKVVGDEQVVAGERHRVAPVDAPGRVVIVLDHEDPGRVGKRGIAHPDPDKPVAAFDRVGVDVGAGRDAVLSRNAHAGAFAVKGQPMISAFDVVALDAPFRQGQLAVRAGVQKCDRGTRFGPVDNDLFAQDHDLLRLAGDLVVPGSDVPGVAKIHVQPLLSGASGATGRGVFDGSAGSWRTASARRWSAKDCAVERSTRIFTSRVVGHQRATS